jgi:uncharacterized protein DUF6600/FecR-like protein
MIQLVATMFISPGFGSRHAYQRLAFGDERNSGGPRLAMRNRIFAIMITVLAFCLFLPKSVEAEEAAPGAARISQIQGEVSVMRGDTGEWVATTVNAPLAPGDSISTGERSRAEVQLDYANVLRLDQRSEAKVADLTREHIQVQVASGLVNFTVLKSSQAEVEIDTPNMAVHPAGEGSYRIQVNSPSDTEITVRKGQAQVSTPQGSTNVETDQTIYVQGTDNPQYRTARADPKDDFDQWNNHRDHEILEARSWGYTNPYYTGTEDLDRYGHWQRAPDYGSVWVPEVGPDWVPYRDGSWEWQPYWGWTWVGFEPWGWAPYHYGRWFWWGNSWAWWPGFVSAGFFPTWGPGWVSFLGFGGRSWGFGFGFGSIGWCPLGPFDPFFPWWGPGNTFNVVNITNITNVTNINNIGNVGVHRYVGNAGGRYVTNLQAALTDPHVRRAITTVPTNQFVNGRVPRHVATVDPSRLRQASVIQGKVPAVPTARSLSPVDRRVNRAALPRPGATAQHFYTQRPAPAGPAPFREQARQIQQMVQSHRPGAVAGNANPSVGAANGYRAGQPAPRPAEGFGRAGASGNAGLARTGSGPTGAGAVGTFARGTPAQGPATRSELPGGRSVPSGPAAGREGWHRFGQAPSAPAGASARPGNNFGARYPSSVTLDTPGQRPTQPGRETSRGGSTWSHFSTTPLRPTPQQPPSARSFQARPAPSSGRNERSGWQRFSPQQQSTPVERGPAATPPRSQTWTAPNRGGSAESPWRSSPRYQASPRSFERPPLELRKPIVRERAPGAYYGGGGRGWSAPSGSGRSYSAPSGGGRSYSAPSGGGRSYSAPSGGGRSYSAPSGGGHSYSAPSGGGHSSSGGGSHRK